MKTLLQKLQEQAKVETETTNEAPAAVDKTGFFSRTSGPAPVNLADLPAPAEETEEASTAQDGRVESDATETNGKADLESTVRDLQEQIRQLHSSSHQAGRIDNETLLKAQRYDALMQDPTRRAVVTETDLPELDGEAKEIYQTLRDKPGYKQALDRMFAEAMRADPVLKSAVQKQQEIDAYLQTQRRGSLEQEVRELGKYVKVETIPQDVAKKVEAIRLNPAFEGMTVPQIYEMVTGQKLKKTPAAPPPSEVRRTARTTEPIRTRTTDIREAARRAQIRLQKER